MAEATPYELPVVKPPVSKDDPQPGSRKSAIKTKAPGAVEYPWESMPEGAIQTYVVDLPADLHCKLKWLGGQTWGTSMRKIVVAALEAEASRLLKEKGIGK